MTPDEKRIVRETFPEIRRIAIPASLLFYGRLFDLDPSLRPLFKIDMAAQSEKLVAMLESILDSLDRFDAMRPVLRELGRRHVEYGVKPAHYETLTSAMVWAFSQALEPNVDAGTRKAWRSVLEEVGAEMLKGAAEAPPPPAA
jgi:hemoglobin-like flavoprotein